MKLLISPFMVALYTMVVGANNSVINEAVDSMPNPELVKFTAPIVAALLSKLIDRLFNVLDKRADRKRKAKEV